MPRIWRLSAFSPIENTLQQPSNAHSSQAARQKWRVTSSGPGSRDQGPIASWGLDPESSALPDILARNALCCRVAKPHPVEQFKQCPRWAAAPGRRARRRRPAPALDPGTRAPFATHGGPPPACSGRPATVAPLFSCAFAGDCGFGVHCARVSVSPNSLSGFQGFRV
jgi:hypothetical protein